MGIEVNIHTDDDKLKKICTSYWALTDSGVFEKTVSALATEYGYSSSELQKVVKMYSSAFIEEKRCVICSSPYPIDNRSALKIGQDCKDWTCDRCKAAMIGEANEAKRQRLLSAYKSVEKDDFIVSMLSAKKAVSLLAVLRSFANEDLTELNEYSSAKVELLSPDESYDFDILRYLHQSNLIAVSYNSQLDQITLNDDGGFSYYLSKVRWLLPINEKLPLSSIYAALDDYITSKELLKADKDGVRDLCYEVSRIECLSYLQHSLMEHQLGFNPGEKTNLIILGALNHYSVSQVYNFIWRAAKDAAAFYARNRVSRDHASKTVVGNIEKQMEKSLANGWDVKSFRRNFDRPQSQLSRVLFNSLLGTDDGGFNIKISEILRSYESS